MRRSAVALPVMILAALTSRPALAQRSGEGFLFGESSGSFGIRFGYSRPTAGGDLFRFVTDQLTVRRRDFAAISMGADAGFRVSPKSDLVVGVSYAGTRNYSEFRDYVDNNDLPIQQHTDFARAPISVSWRYYLASRGRAIGRLAWVPARRAPFVGGGVGYMYYRFRQAGDFVDFNTMNVFHDVYNSSGWAPMAQLFAGIELSLTNRVVITTEARYVYARAHLSQDFVGFKPLDLSGFAVTTGLGLR